MYQNRIVKVIDLFDLDTGAFYQYGKSKRAIPTSTNRLCIILLNNTSIPRTWVGILKQNNPSPPSIALWKETFDRLLTKGKPTKFFL